MARTATAGQITALESPDRQVVVRLQIEDHAATLQDYTRPGGASVDWFNGAQGGLSVDQRAATLSVTLHREISGTSLAPSMNANAPIEAGRDIVFSVAVLAQDATVTGSDWIEFFRGTIDDVSWGGDTVVLQCRDQFGRILDSWVESEATYGNTATPEALETVAQEILDDVFGASVINLVTPSSPGFGIVEYTQRIQSAADALGALTDLIGWDLRYKWDQTAGEFQPKLTEPDRTKTTPDLTLGAADYYAVADIAKSTQGVRNVAIGKWAEGSFVTAENAASIAEYGRRPIFLDSTQDPQINTAGKMTTLIEAVITDLGQPLTAKTVEGPFDWRPELGDLVRWTANSVHASSDLDQAIVAMEYTFAAEADPTIVYHTRGKPSGGNLRWHRKEAKRKGAHNTREILPEPDTTPRVAIGPISRDPATDNVLVALVGQGDTENVRVTLTVGDGTSEPADPLITDTALGAAVGVLDTGVTAAAGQTVWVKARGEKADATLAAVEYIAEAKHEVAGVPDGSVDNDSLAASLKIAVDKIVNQAAGFATDIGIRAGPSEDRIQWDTGTIWYADGTSDAVTGADELVNSDAAATGTWFVYWNGTAMAYTQTWSTVLSATVNVLLATANRSVATENWTVIPAIGVLGVTGPPIQTEHLVASAITADKIAANSVTATKISVTTLSAIVADVGTLTAGVLQNASGTRYIDLGASGTDPFIEHDNFSLLADGTATFSGALSAASGSFSGSLSAATGTFAGNLTASVVQANGGAFTSSPGAITAYTNASLIGGGSVNVVGNGTNGEYGGMSHSSGSGLLTITSVSDTGPPLAYGGVRFVCDDMGFFSATAIAQPDVTGSRGSNAALASLLTALANLGLVTDSST